MLHSIADKIESGSITLTEANSAVELAIPSQVTLEIKAEEEQGSRLKKSLEVEIEWVEGETQDSGVTIS